MLLKNSVLKTHERFLRVFPDNLSFQRNTVGILFFISVLICIYKSGIAPELCDS